MAYFFEEFKDLHKVSTFVEVVRDNAKLLLEMLASYYPGRSPADELELIKEVYKNCERLRPLCNRLALQTPANDPMKGPVINASNLLVRALDKYTLVIEQGKSPSEAEEDDDDDDDDDDDEVDEDDLSTPNEEKLPLSAVTGQHDELEDVAGAVGIEHEEELGPEGLAELDLLSDIMLKDNLPPFCRLPMEIPMNVFGGPQDKSSVKTSSEASAPIDFGALEEKIQSADVAFSHTGRGIKRPWSSTTLEEISGDDSIVDISERRVKLHSAVSGALNVDESFCGAVMESEMSAEGNKDNRSRSGHVSKRMEVRSVTDVLISLDISKPAGPVGIEREEEREPEGLSEFDLLSDIMLKDNLPSSSSHQSSFSRPPMKIPMNLFGRPEGKLSVKSSSEAPAPMDLGVPEEKVQGGDAVAFSQSGRTLKKPLASNTLEQSRADDSMVNISESSVELHGAIVVAESEDAASKDQRFYGAISATASAGVINVDSSMCGDVMASEMSVEENKDCRSGHDSKRVEVKSLADILISLNGIKPGSIPPYPILDEKNGLSVVLHFARDAPRPDVSVIVVTTINRSTKPITSFIFQASIPKTCRLRVLPPSGSDLPAHNPFLTPSAINQIMLIASPNKDPISLKYMISYTLDGETTTEMGEVEKLPLGT